MNKKGLTIWELMLFTLFLAVAIGASVFFFMLQSDDFKKAQQKYEWVRNVNQVLDEVSLELANAVIVSFPVSGPDKECFYRSAMNSGNLLPSIAQEGFSFSQNSLNYVSRNASASAGLRRLGRFNNPLVANCREGKFLRLGPDRLEISFKVNAPDNSGEIKQFRRVINLRNQ
jgi:hypothetical protein